MKRRCIGGPLEGETITSPASIIELAAYPGMAYHRTWDPPYHPDPDWFIRDVPEPPKPESVYEWHERNWVSPAVAAIRGAVREATDRWKEVDSTK